MLEIDVLDDVMRRLRKPALRLTLSCPLCSLLGRLPLCRPLAIDSELDLDGLRRVLAFIVVVVDLVFLLFGLGVFVVVAFSFCVVVSVAISVVISIISVTIIIISVVVIIVVVVFLVVLDVWTLACDPRLRKAKRRRCDYAGEVSRRLAPVARAASREDAVLTIVKLHLFLLGLRVALNDALCTPRGGRYGGHGGCVVG